MLGGYVALFVNLVAAGETGGILDTIMTRLAMQTEKSVKLAKQIKGALFYPTAVMAVAIGAMAVASYACRIAGYLLMGYVPITARVEGALKAIPLGVMIGIAAFAVALPLASRWYPPEHQGLALFRGKGKCAHCHVIDGPGRGLAAIEKRALRSRPAGLGALGRVETQRVGRRDAVAFDGVDLRTLSQRRPWRQFGSDRPRRRPARPLGRTTR